MSRAEDMWQCQTVNCGYIYDPDKGDRKGKIPKGTRFEDLPEDWKCPICGASKKALKPLAGPGSVRSEHIEQPKAEAAPAKAAPAGKKYACSVCGYQYDPAKGDRFTDIPKDTPFESVPENWKCPVCGSGKAHFKALPEQGGDETTTNKGAKDMSKYVCGVCGYVYDPAAGDPDANVPPGTAFEDLPEDWSCPICGAEKDQFEKQA